MRRYLWVFCVACALLGAAPEAAALDAYYTRVRSGEGFERHSRTGSHADVVVRLDEGRLVFWRGSSYLPYWQSAGAKWYVPELVKRAGDGPEKRPDRVNTYSHVKIIESTPEKAVVLWRYLPKFEGTNPHLNPTNVKYAAECPALAEDVAAEHLVRPEDFVEELFVITPDGTATRTVRRGTERLEDWKDPRNRTVQRLRLTPAGVEVTGTRQPGSSAQPEPVEGAPVVEATVRQPVRWWRFDEGEGSVTLESVGGSECRVAGPKAYWRRGVSDTTLAFDGYETEVRLPARTAPRIGDEITLEGWVALGAYPWNWRPVVQQGRGEERRYALEVGPFGHVKFSVSVGGALRGVESDRQLQRKHWYHLAGVYDGDTGTMRLFIDGERCGERTIPGSGMDGGAGPVRIGKGRDMIPADAIRPAHTFAESFALDGLIDEVRIYDEALVPREVRRSCSKFGLSATRRAHPDLEERTLPSGKDTGEFGAYYTHLRFYETRDGMFRFGPYPDVMVEFDRQPTKFAFWRGTCFIPMLTNEKGFWYSNEFNETWGRSGGIGCQEPMSDKESFSNHARIIENSPARVGVQWRYPLVDVLHTVANFDPETGWGDWADWYYYIYPDGVAVKRMRLWSSGPYNHEWHEAMAIPGPGQHPEEVLETDPALRLVGLDGDTREYSWTDGPPDGVNYNGMKVHVVNYKGRYDPFTIGDFRGGNVYGGEVTDYSVFPAWNHWPVAQMPSDGRYAKFPDRTAHSSLTHLRLPVHEQRSGDRPYQERLLMEGMSKKTPEELAVLARSWLRPPELEVQSGAAGGSYDRSQRAYLMAAESSSLAFSVEGSAESPVVNPCFVIRNWGGEGAAELTVNGETQKRGGDFRQGTITDVDGTATKVVWVEIQSTSPVEFTVRGAQPDLRPVSEVGWKREPAVVKRRMAVAMEAEPQSGPEPTAYYFEFVNGPENAGSGWQSGPAYTARGLSPGKTYRFRVRARNRYFRESEWSQVVSVTTPAAPEPQAHWTFDAGAGAVVMDSAGSHRGEVREDARWSPDGRVGGCLELDGETEIRVTGAGPLRSTGAFTWMAWIRTTGDGTIMGRTGAGRRWERGGKVFFVQDGRLHFDVGWVGQVASGATAADGRWHHVAVAVASPMIRLYVDGRLAGGGRLEVGRFDDSGLPVKIGYCNRDFPDEPGFEGMIDEVRCYGFYFNGPLIEDLYGSYAGPGERD